LRVGARTKRFPSWLVAACLIGAGFTTGGSAAAEPIETSLAASTSTAPAHNLADARTHPVVPRNSWHHDVLARHSQQNWYRLELTSRSYLYTLLGALPANYNLRLYNDAGKLLSKSERGALLPETVGRSLDAGTYFLRVASTRGSDPRKSYQLLVRVVGASATGGVLTARIDNADGVVGDVVNVSNRTLTATFLDVSFYGANGKLLRRISDSFNTLWIPMAPGSRAPFKMYFDVPKSVLKKTKRVAVVPKWSAIPARSAAKLSVSHAKRTNQHHQGWTDVKVTGRIRNNSSQAVKYPVAVLEVHDKRGVMIGLERTWDLRRIAAHGTRKFALSYFSYTANPTTRVKVFEILDTVPDPE
jgi:hypothetical protein